MSMNSKKFFAAAGLLILLGFSFPVPAQASPWAHKTGYWNQTGGKFVFGLKHTLFSWLSWWTESREPQYTKEWEGFTVGLGKTLPYTAAGMIQLVTFPIPVDFPNIGIGLHIPSKECPLRHDENRTPVQTAPSQALKAAAPSSKFLKTSDSHAL